MLVAVLYNLDLQSLHFRPQSLKRHAQENNISTSPLHTVYFLSPNSFAKHQQRKFPPQQTLIYIP
jgi:hypothetical protein